MARVFDYKNKLILITQIRLHDYAGSEIVTLELARFFSSQGASVLIATHTYGGVIKDHFRVLKNVKVILSNSKSFDRIIEEAKIDIVWVHHQYIPEVLLQKAGLKFVYHHMSPYVELESPLFWRVEDSLADAILFNSPETKDKYTSIGYFNDKPDKLHVFGNPAPLEFFDAESSKNKELSRILIVSNHPPIEIEEVKTLLEQTGVDVRYLGSNDNGRPLLVTPEQIAGVDAVITIGKTVQYALAVGTPVYCYDHFGGPGYLSKNNYEKAKELNFSGRGFRKKTALKISEDIIKNYSKAKKFSLYAKNELAREFRLDQALENIINRLFENKNHTKKPRLSKLDSDAYLNNMRIIERNVRGVSEIQSAANLTLNKKINELQQITENLSQELKGKQDEIERIYRSTSFRFGFKLVKPLAKARKIVKKYIR